MATITWTPMVRKAGYRVQHGTDGLRYGYTYGRVEVLDDETVIEVIEWRVSGPATDSRGVDLHVAPNSPRGSLRKQIADHVRDWSGTADFAPYRY